MTVVLRPELHEIELTDGRTATARVFGPLGGPTVAAFHPGGFTQGEPSWCDRFAAAHAERSLTYVSLPYRLAVGGVTVLDQVADAALGVRWVADRSERFLTGGHSAGGWLALMNATAAGVVGTVVLSPAPRLSSGLGPFVPADATPEQLDPTLASGDLPELAVLHGDQDQILPFDGSERLVDAWRARGGTATLDVVAGADHFFNQPRHADAAHEGLATAAARLLA